MPTQIKVTTVNLNKSGNYLQNYEVAYIWIVLYQGDVDSRARIYSEIGFMWLIAFPRFLSVLFYLLLLNLRIIKGTQPVNAQVCKLLTKINVFNPD